MTDAEFLSKIVEIRNRYMSLYATATPENRTMLILKRFAELQALVNTFAGPLDPTKTEKKSERKERPTYSAR